MAQPNKFAFALITSLFFLWGFAHNLDPILIPHLKRSFTLTTLQATLVDSAVFIGVAFLVGRFFGTFMMKYIKGESLLTIYALMNIVLCAIAIVASGMITVYAIIGICFFMSIMFPTIFALGIINLKADTEYGSSLLIMSIVGGAVLPRVFGYISDSTGNIKNGYIVPLICFIIIAWFGWKGHKADQLKEKI